MEYHCVVLFLLSFVCLFRSVISGNNYVRIAGIFDAESEEEVAAFKHAVELVNNERRPITLMGETRIVPKDDYSAQQTVCTFLSHGSVGFIGPGTEHIRSLCDAKEIPQVETRSNPFQHRSLSNVNLHPHLPILARAYVDLIRSFKWKNPVVLYEDDDSFPRIQEILKLSNDDAHVRVMQLDEKHIGDFRPTLLALKRSKWTEVVIDCSLKALPLVLEQALQVGIMADDYNYFITNLDLHTLDLFAYQHGGANITGLRLVDTDNPLLEKTIQALRLKQGLRTELALVHDAVRLLADALRHAGVNQRNSESSSVACNSTGSWRHGSSVLNYLRTRSLTGLSGSIIFDHQGFRSDFSLSVLELSKKGLETVGSWNSTEGLNVSRGNHNLLEGEQSLQNKSFVVLIALSDPYNMLKEASQKLTGNDRFEGYGIDLIHELSLMLGFNYTFRLQEDGQYGILDLKSGKWNGMILELLEHRADLAITDLTITSERESAVDFTMPFMNLGISILYKKPMKLPPSLFSFLSPFSGEVWRYLGGAYIGVSLALYILARISPAEWINRYPCHEEPDFLENQFSFRNSLWFTTGSLMQQGSEIAPIAISTRMVAGLWWFFTLIIVSTYTANLAACLTVESLSAPFKNIDELVTKKDVIKFGAKHGGSTANFFRDSIHPAYRKISKYMEKHPDVMTDLNLEGVTRAENENYAFFMESTTIEYTIQRHCNLTQVGGLLDDKGYGIAMRKNSPYRNILSTAVLKLQETGRLTALKIKWWKEKRGGGACHSETGTGDAQELDLANVGGVFFVLVVGSLGGLLVGIIELLIHTLKLSFQKKTTFRHQLANEIKFLLDFRLRTKRTFLKNQQRRKNSHSHDNSVTYQQPYGFIPEFNKTNLR